MYPDIKELKSQIIEKYNAPSCPAPQLVLDYYDIPCEQTFKFRAFGDAIQVMEVKRIPQPLLLTFSTQSLLRIWSLLGELICVVNVEHPLPYRWRLKINRYDKRQEQYVKAMKLFKELEMEQQMRIKHAGNAKSMMDNQRQPEQKHIFTFAGLLRQIETTEKSNFQHQDISLRKMEARKHRMQTEHEELGGKDKKNDDKKAKTSSKSVSSTQGSTNYDNEDTDRKSRMANPTFECIQEMMEGFIDKEYEPEKDVKEAMDVYMDQFEKDYNMLKSG